MLPLVLPGHMRRAWRRGFGLSLGLVAWLTVACLAWLIKIDHGQVVAALVGLGVMSVALTSRRYGAALYRWWNALAGGYKQVLRLATKVVCFYGVLEMVWLIGPSEDLHAGPQGASTWLPRMTLPPASYGALDSAAKPGGRAGSWLASYLAWSGGTGRIWACCLIPFLLLLAALDQEVDESIPSHVYTLF